jgi:predicted dehydrogenase
MEELRAIIIGCGAIAGGYNEQASVAGTFSHAAAYQGHPGFTIAACIEPDRVRRAAFMEYWSIENGFDNLNALLTSDVPFDVASVCAPTSMHEPLLVELATAGVRGVFCEKPMTADIDRTRAIAADYRAANVPLAVNYTRRWNPSIQELATQIENDKFGAVLSGVATYDRGVLHHGSHMVDLIQMLVGPVNFDRFLAARAGHTDDDPICDAVATNAAGAPITLIGVDAGSTGMFELQLIFEHAAIALEDFSRYLRIRPADSEPLVPGRRRLADKAATETRWPEALERAFLQFHDAVCTGAVMSSNGTNAVSAESICNEIWLAATSPGSNAPTFR